MQYNHVDLLSVHPAISINKEIPPGMPARELRTIASKHGAKLAGVDLVEDEYVLRVNIAGKNKQEAWQVRTLLAAWATSSGEQTAPLVPTHWPQVAYNAIVKSIKPPEFIFGHGTVEIVFALTDPVPYEQTASTAEGVVQAVVNIGGTDRARPVITYTPGITARNFQLTLDGKTFFAIKDQVVEGEPITIDMGEGSLLINGRHAEERIIYTSTDWHPGFTPGSHTVRANVTGEMQVRWHNRWA